MGDEALGRKLRRLRKKVREIVSDKKLDIKTATGSIVVESFDRVTNFKEKPYANNVWINIDSDPVYSQTIDSK